MWRISGNLIMMYRIRWSTFVSHEHVRMALQYKSRNLQVPNMDQWMAIPSQTQARRQDITLTSVEDDLEDSVLEQRNQGS